MPKRGRVVELPITEDESDDFSCSPSPSVRSQNHRKKIRWDRRAAPKPKPTFHSSLGESSDDEETTTDEKVSHVILGSRLNSCLRCFLYLSDVFDGYMLSVCVCSQKTRLAISSFPTKTFTEVEK